MDSILTIYPPEQWRALADQLQRPLLGPEERALSRTLYSKAVPCEFDTQGRVALSQEQRRLAGIEPRSTVVVIGNGARVEIWAEARWDSYSDDAAGRFTELADRLIQAR